MVIKLALEKSHMRPSTARIMLLIVIACLITACAHHSQPAQYAAPYGIVSGLWHGFIAFITIPVNIISFLLSLVGIQFLDDIQIVGSPNTGFFYYVGFFIGFGGSVGSIQSR